MADIAFHGDPAVKAQALSRLRSHIAAGTFVYFPAWEAGKANAIGAVVEADDISRYAEELGYPLAIANVLGALVNAFKGLDAAAEFAEAWLARTPVGADLSNVVSKILVVLLEQRQLAELTRQTETIEESRQAVLALHRRAISGDAPDRREWKAVRLAAVAASDATADDPDAKIAGSIVEAAAWPGSMRSVLNDTLGALGNLETRLILQKIGWTEADESRVFRIREQAEVDGRMAELNGLDRVLGLLDADAPQLAKGFRERLAAFESLGADYRNVGRTLIELFEQAPIAATQNESGCSAS